MFLIDFDVSDIEKRATSLGASADQLPYVMSLVLNDAVDSARRFIIDETWPTAVRVRNNSFIGRVFNRQAMTRATKYDLQAELRDSLGRANLMLHAMGGVRYARQSNIAIPNSANVQRTQSGVRKNQRPLNLTNSLKKDNKIYQRMRDGKLRLMYVLKPNAQIRKDVPFYEDFEKVTGEAIKVMMPIRVGQAMASRRK